MSNTEPRSGLKFGWSPTTENFSAEMDTNLNTIGRLAVPNLYIKDRTLTAPPGSPTAGDAYIPAATATGAWAGKEGQIAIWSGTAWVFYPASIGWLAVVLNEGTNGKLIVKISGGWSSGVTL